VTEEETVRASRAEVEQLACIATDMLINGELEIVPVVIDVKEFLEDDDFLESLVTTEAGFVDPFGQLKQFISDLISTIASWVAESIGSAVKGFIDWLWQQISPALDSISGWIDEATKRLKDLGSTFEGFVNAILKFPEWFPNWFKENIADPIASALESLARWIWEHLPDWFKSAIEGIRTALDNFFKDPVGTLQKALGYLAQQLWNLLPDWLKNALTGLREAWDSFVKSAENFFKDPWGNIKSALESLAKWIWDMLPDWLKGAIQSIQSAWNAFVEGLKDFLRNPVEFIQKRFQELTKWIWDHLPDWLKGAIQAIQNAWNAFVQGLQDFLKDPVGWISARLQDFARWIWERLPEPVKWFIKNAKKALEGAWDALVKFFTQDLPGFFAWLWERIQEFIKDPLGTIIRGLEDLSEKVWGFLRDVVWPAIVGFGEWLYDRLKDLASAAASALSATIAALSEAARPIYDALQSLVTKPLEEGMKLFRTAVEEIARDVATPWETKLGEVGTMIVFLGPVLMTHSLMAVASDALGGLADTLEDIEVRGEAEGSGEPLGMGIAGRVLGAVRARLAAFARWLAETFKKKADDIMFGATAAFMFWNLEFMRYVMRPYWINMFAWAGADALGFEMPGVSESIRLLQRYYPTKYATTIFDKIAASLYYRGYPAWWYEYVTKPVRQIYEELVPEATEEYIISIKDRFGTTRKLPATPFFDIPTASEMCTMMVRDIFHSLEDFSKAILMRGYVPDIAYMYYLLHFRYPSPERLWQFVSRGIAGLLWYEPTDAELEVASEEAEKIGAHAPTPPTEFNLRESPLLRAFSWYMKWHDYARFAWLSKDDIGFDKNFTSDNWIIIDTLADIPTKIDIRWMVKWGIFDFMRAKGVGLNSPSSEFTRVLEAQVANEKVVMDLSLMCRLLRATGMHPHYVPLVAVAETINALADERTLLRTGLINIYEYGAMTYKDLDELMANLVTASFIVSVYDSNAQKWVPRAINIPVMYLPAERRLLELRALIDRYLRIFRDTLHDLERAYTEYIIDSKAVARRMDTVLRAINEPFGAASAEIVGKKLAMTLDTAYITAALEAWKVARDVYTVRRIRSWVYRVLGWVIYRTAYGYVTEDDAKRIAKTLSSIAKLPKVEADAILKILSEMVGIARREYQREYIPTPLSLATMAEYMPAVRKLAPLVFEAKGVPQEWRPYWLQYIDMRPLADEIGAVLSSGRRLYEYFIINVDMFKKFLEAFTPWGYEEREIKLIMDRSNLDRWYRAWRELVGTPRELVTMAEYVPQARQLALAEVKKRIDALPIEQEAKEFLYKMWEDYIRIRPVYNEVQREITELINDYARGAITWEQFTALLEELKEWGIDEWEIDSYKFIAYMRRRRYVLTGYAEGAE